MIKVLYFARVSEALGLDEEQLWLPSGIEDVAALIEHLAGRGEAWLEVLEDRRGLLVAVNQEMASRATQLADGDEVAFFPPVTGG